MKIGSLEFNYPLIILAPLLNFSDNGMRILSKKFGADITYTGMISCYEIVKKRGLKFKILDKERPIAIQIFGNDEEIFKKATEFLNDFADIIDINFSCPSNKIIKNESGGYLLKDVEKIKRIIDKTVKASKVPVSVKIRSGFSNEDETYKVIGKICEDYGVAYITIHPRSVIDKFNGDSDLKKTKKLKEEIKIPVIHSGDIKDHISFKRVLEETKCDGIMIGRKAIGNPWIFSDIKRYITYGTIPQKVSLEEKINTIKEHIDILISLYGEGYALKQMKLHVPKYLSGYPKVSRLNKLLNGVKSIKELLNLLSIFRFL